MGGDPWKRESGDLRLFWCYLNIFLGGNPWKRESGDLRLLYDYFFWWQPLEKGVWRFEIALGLFLYFFWWQPLEKGVYFFLVAPLGKGSLEI